MALFESERLNSKYIEMKVSNEVYTVAELILNTFEPNRLKAKEVAHIEKRQLTLEAKLRDLEVPIADHHLGQSLTQNYEKWDLIDKQITLEEQKEEVINRDYTKEAEVKDMFGCNRDHSKEIDIYNKPFHEKMERVEHLKAEGNESFKLNHYDKASYYYAQALLIFYYLIPDTKEQDQEVADLKRVCHRNQAVCFMKLQRMKDALKEVDMALKEKKSDHL